VDAEADDASFPLRWSEADEEGGMGCGMLGGRCERDGRGGSLLRDARGGEFSGELFPLLFEPDEDECLAGGAMLLLFFCLRTMSGSSFRSCRWKSASACKLV
jgi:hypothetical protein